MKCILCLKTTSESINIFEEHGVRLDIKNIICKHFWLQPIHEDINASAICTSCWESVDSFNKFYQEIERIHCELLKIKPPDEDSVEEKSPSRKNDFEDHSNRINAEIKLEVSEDEKTRGLEPESQSDSESDIPLANLSKIQTTFDCQLTSQLDDDTKMVIEEKPHIIEGKWIACCVSEENTNKPASPEELDKFITQNIELSCEICQVAMANFTALQVHFKEACHSAKPFVTCCDKKFMLRSRLVDHILRHKLPDYFTCVLCSKVLSSRQNLKKHMDTHDKKFTHQCDKCDKRFYRKQLLDRHMDVHIVDRTFKCDECAKLFASKFSLGQHIYSVHKGGYKKICEQCGKVSPDRESFLRHQLEHTNQPKPFVKCHKCGVKLANKNGLRKHLQSQHSEDTTEHVCNVCGSTAATIFALKRHITYMHKYQRVHKCPMCDKAFKKALVLKPNANEINAKYICCTCWNKVHSFHEFYQFVEEAHTNLSTLKLPPEDNDPETNTFDAYSDFFDPDIKVEHSDDDHSEADVGEHASSQNDMKELMNSDDSEFDVPLVKLSNRESKSEQLTDNETSSVHDQEMSESDNESDYKPTKKKTKQKTVLSTNKDSTKTGVSCRDFDDFIKKHMQLTCPICKKPSKNFFSLKEHCQSAHKEVAYVTCCDKQFSSRFSLVHHLMIHQDPDFFKCGQCGRVLANKKSFKNHMKSHKNRERVYKCPKCPKSFPTEQWVEKHLKTHNIPPLELICEQCGKVCRSRQGLKAHQLREHTDFRKERVQCKICGAYLADTSTLHTHTKYQHPKKEVLNVCNICGKISASGYGLKRHILYMHTMERRHKCHLCNKAFKLAQVLRPNEEDINAKVICKSCWTALHAFHKFYLEVEEAHVRLQRTIQEEELKLENEAVHLESFPDGEPNDEIASAFLESDIKLEVKEDAEVSLATNVSVCENNESKLEPQTESLYECKEAPAVRSTRSRKSTEMAYAESESSSDDEIDSDHAETRRSNSSLNWQEDENSDNVDDDSDYEDNRVPTSNKCDEPSKEIKKRGRPRKVGTRSSPHKKKRFSQEQSTKMQRIQEYDETIAKNMKLSCAVCLEVFLNFAVLKRHFRSKHNECGYVACCGKKFRKRGVLVDHIYTHQNPEYFKCDKCGRVLANRKGLDCHMLTHDTEKQRIYQCDQCTLSFFTRPLLTRHLQTHISERNIKCPECDKFFSTQDILRTHINNVHNAAYTRICDQCGKSFRRPDAFRRHQLEHDGITQPMVPCEKCNVKLTSKYGLKRHMESMHPETDVKHVCNECGKIAPSAAALQRHVSYMHKMERKYKCPMCDKAFKKTGGLKVNQMLSTNEHIFFFY